jgi:hypothetical protein
MSDLRRLYQGLSHDADAAGRLAPPAAIRQRSDRRRRTAASLAAVTALALVAGGAAAARRMLTADYVPSPPAASAAPSPTASPAPSGAAGSTLPPPPNVIPDAAFLRKSDVNSDEGPTMIFLEAEAVSSCGRQFPTRSQRVAIEGRQVRYWFSGRPTTGEPDAVVEEIIGSYRGDGAQRHLDEVRDAIGRCPQRTQGQVTFTYRLLEAPDWGDGAVLYEVTYPMGGNPSNPNIIMHTHLVATVRVGNVVVELHDYSTTRTTSDQAVFAALTAKAVDRARAWLGY